MPKLAANLSWLYQDIAFLDRFAAAAAHGFTAVEFLFPYDFPAADIAARLKASKLRQVLFNLPPGDWSKGERGLAALPGREAEFAAALETAIGYALTLECPRVHVMSGLIATGMDLSAMRRTYVDNLKRATERAAKEGLSVCMEPINRRDIPGYFLNTTTEAAAIIREIGAPNLKIQFDLYHCQVTEGDVVRRAEALMPLIGHVQVAGNPDRNEPDIGEANHLYTLEALDRLGYDGHVGLEYKPKTTTAAGLRWAGRYGIHA
ncbi:MAG: hydroxypyruvate isomerase family protein [Rhodospirillales bacterium]|nr:MAG: hydroxypyruvate isomerase family protein [Rhodospirillales bacterium]